MQHAHFRVGTPGAFASQALGFVAFAATLLSAIVVHATPAPVSELPTKWQVPPGDPLEYETAGFAATNKSAIVNGGDGRPGAPGGKGK